MKKLLSMMLAMLMIFTAIPVNAQGAKVERIAGANRYETSVLVSREKADTSQYAVIASGEVFADALPGGAFAARIGAPLLLSKKDVLPKEVKNELQRLNVSKIYVLGGEVTISKEVFNELKTITKDVERISGSNRYETAKEIKREYAKHFSNVSDTFVSGTVYPDALSAAPLVAAQNGAILLNDGKTTVTNGRIIGGANRVPGNVTRIAGSNRYATAVEVANTFIKDVNKDLKTVYVASGENYPDALAAAPLAYANDTVLLLSSDGSVTRETQKFIQDNNIEKVVIIGGTISETVARQMASQAPSQEDDDIWDDYEINGNMLDVLPIEKPIEEDPQAPVVEITKPVEYKEVIVGYEEVKRPKDSGNDPDKPDDDPDSETDVPPADVDTGSPIEYEIVKVPIIEKVPEPVDFSKKPYPASLDAVQKDFTHAALHNGEFLAPFYATGVNNWMNRDDKLDIIFRANGISPIYELKSKGVDKESKSPILSYNWARYYENDYSNPEVITMDKLKANDAKIKNMINASKAGGSDLEKAAAITAYIKNNFKYNLHDNDDHSVFALTETGQARCAGFAATGARALNLMGIPAYNAKATISTKDDHAVIRAYLDGKWQTIEVTPAINHSGTDTEYEKNYILNTRYTESTDNSGRYTVYVNSDAEQWFLNNQVIFGK